MKKLAAHGLVEGGGGRVIRGAERRAERHMALPTTPAPRDTSKLLA